MSSFLDEKGLKTLVGNINKKYQTWISKDTNLYVRYLGIGELGKYAAIYETGTAKFETTTIGNNIHLYSSGDVVFNIKDTSTEGFHYWGESGNVNLKGNLVINNGACTVWADSGTIDATNINLGGTISVKDSSYSYIDVKVKNPNAYALDNSLDKTNIGASGQFAAAFGGNTGALGKRSMAQGTATVAKGAYSHAEGDNSVTLGADSHAEGYATVAYGTATHAEGSSTIAVGGNSHAEGAGSISEGAVSHAEGTKTRAKGINAHTEGWNTLVGPKPSSSQGSSTGAGSSGGSGSSGEGTEGDDFDPTVPNNAHAEGSSTVAYGYGAHAEGVNTWANQYSHSEGYGTHSEGEKSHAEGFLTHAQGIASHTEGQATVATAHFAHAEGQETQAIGLASHAGGYKSQVMGNYSIVHGTGLKNYSNNSAVFGKYNNTGSIFAIGNGTSDTARSNAFEVKEDGSAKIYGNLDVDGKELRCGGVLVLTQNSDYLFRHSIGVVAGTIIGSFEFTSTSNIVCNTLNNLRIALRPGTASGSTLRLFGSTMKYESCTLEVTTSSCKVYMYDRSTDKAISADVTVVADTVFMA